MSEAIALEGLRRDFGERTALAGVSLRLEDGRGAAGAGPQRSRQDDAAAGAGGAAAPQRRRSDRARLPASAAGLAAARAGRLSRPRAVALPRPERPREPPLPRPPARDRRTRSRGADRVAAGGDGDGAARRRAHRAALGRDAPAAGGLPLRPPRAGAAAPRRARGAPRRRGPRAGAGADRRRQRTHPRRRHATIPSASSPAPTGCWSWGMADYRSASAPPPRSRPTRFAPSYRGPRERGSGKNADPLAGGVRGNPRQGPALGAADAALAAGDGAFRGHDLRHLPLRPRPDQPRGKPGRRSALDDAAVRGDPRHRPAVRRRARRGRLRRDPAGADRSNGALRRQGGRPDRLPGGPGADHRSRLRALLPRLGRRPGAAACRPRARQSGPGGDRDAGLLDGGQLPGPGPAGAAALPAAGGAADDRRHRAPRSRCSPQEDLHTTASAPGWRFSVYTIWCSSASDTPCSTSCSRTR